MRVLDDQDIRDMLRPDETQRERRWIEQRISELVTGGRRRGRRGMTGKRGRSGRDRIALLERILREANQPLHYTEIHRRALALLPPEVHFTKENVYTKLFSNDRFRRVGEGVFSLASWQPTVHHTENGHVLEHCPPPLLPANPHPRAFLESILQARQIVQEHPDLRVAQFYAKMQELIGHDRGNPQDAFDAWYIAGLIDRIDYNRQIAEPIRLIIPPEWKLTEVRVHCLDHLCKRLLKTTELLAILERLAMADLPLLQKLLFGSESAGFDVSLRLNMLASFEAVRADGNTWRITEVGRAALRANPPQALPDFSAFEVQEPADSQTEDLDDHLAIFTL
jgi:hypothetical protein